MKRPRYSSHNGPGMSWSFSRLISWSKSKVHCSFCTCDILPSALWTMASSCFAGSAQHILCCMRSLLSVRQMTAIGRRKRKHTKSSVRQRPSIALVRFEPPDLQLGRTDFVFFVFCSKKQHKFFESWKDVELDHQSIKKPSGDEETTERMALTYIAAVFR